MKILLFMAFVVLFTMACATQGGTIKNMNSAWTGQHLDQFVLKNGAPYTSHKLSTGDIAYRWSSGAQNSGVAYTVGNVAVGNSTMVCEIQIITDGNEIIKQITGLNDTEGVWTLSRCAETLKQP